MTQSVSAPAKAAVPEMGNPEMEGIALQETVNAPLLTPVEDQAENLLFFHKEFIYVLPGLQGVWVDCERRNALPLSSTSSFAIRQESAV